MTFRSLNRLALIGALALGCIVMAGTARAQQAPSPAALAAAKELVTLKGGAAMFDPLIPGVIESAKNQLIPTNPQLTKPLNDVAAQFHKEYGAKRAELLDIVAQTYARHFTEAELKDIVAFYKTPAGKKMIAQEPAAIKETLDAAQVWANQLSDEVLQRFRTEMQKKGFKL
jgi:uncharacterized protein